MEEQAFMFREIAAFTGLSRQSVTHMFEREPGVIVFWASRVHAPAELSQYPHTTRCMSVSLVG
jgi:hypothetical protein